MTFRRILKNIDVGKRKMNIPELLKLQNISPELGELMKMGEKKLTDDRLSAVYVAEVCDGAKVHIASQLPLMRLVVTADMAAARSFARKLASWGVKVDVLPPRDEVLLPRRSISPESMLERVGALADIAFGRTDAVVTCVESLIQRFPSAELVKKRSVYLQKEGICSPQDVAKRLVEAGYRRQDMIEGVGEFALRGDILDVFAPNRRAYRINFFDELIENIKLLDVESMLSSNEVDELLLPPLSDLILDADAAREARSALSKNINIPYAAKTLNFISEGAVDPSAVWATPFFLSCTQTLVEYVNSSGVAAVIFDEPRLVHESLLLVLKEFESRTKNLLESGEILPAHKSVCISENEFNRQLLLSRKMAFSSLRVSGAIFEPKMIIRPNCRQITKFYLDPPSMIPVLKGFMQNGTRVIIAAGSRERAKSLIDSLGNDFEVPVVFSEDGNGSALLQATPLQIEVGAVYPSAKIVLIGMSECVGRGGVKTYDGNRKRKFTAPKAGDYVVHRVHGIGLCEGTTMLRTGEFEREFIVLRYKDGDILYVATDQMDNLQKFVGEKDPELNKLGGKEFAREKEKVIRSLRKLAFNLAELYKKRTQQQGYKYGEDTIWQKEFEDDFEYEETPDQLHAIADVKEDMEKGRIMDRLIVGDVGFGKTEVAFRAMFKTALDNKQSVMLAPTTILARQHYENLLRRVARYGIKCALLTRLQKASEVEVIKKGLKEGSIHMLIATHKVFSKDIEFADLGLIVLDEEQRFGVEHKEILKYRNPLVNVLTLSATPIPRTLNMSLTGIRDISMLETPPVGRLPIQTYLVEYDPTVVRDAVNRELARGGQALILYNDISALDRYAEEVENLCPQARVITAHGQMPSGMLEKRISAFYEKRYDVLIATTIIENGIDLPDANTLIVLESDRFGLAQLYQIRGRVGRRGVLAHAYFTVPKMDFITVKAEERLSTLLENTEIGSGFKVSLADMAIRGVGNLLGPEQSGHIAAVGYEMYLELLEAAVEEATTGVVRKPKRDVEMRVDAPAYIRDGYVSSIDKLRVYKRISEVSSLAERDRLIDELSEVYGAVDAPLKNLISISLIKNLAALHGASRVVINKKGATISFYSSDVVDDEALMHSLSEHMDFASMSPSIPPNIVLDFGVESSVEERLSKVILLLG